MHYKVCRQIHAASVCQIWWARYYYTAILLYYYYTACIEYRTMKIDFGVSLASTPSSTALAAPIAKHIEGLRDMTVPEIRLLHAHSDLHSMSRYTGLNTNAKPSAAGRLASNLLHAAQ